MPVAKAKIRRTAGRNLYRGNSAGPQ